MGNHQIEFAAHNFNVEIFSQDKNNKVFHLVGPTIFCSFKIEFFVCELQFYAAIFAKILCSFLQTFIYNKSNAKKTSTIQKNDSMEAATTEKRYETEKQF